MCSLGRIVFSNINCIHIIISMIQKRKLQMRHHNLIFRKKKLYKRKKVYVLITYSILKYHFKNKHRPEKFETTTHVM